MHKGTEKSAYFQWQHFPQNELSFLLNLILVYYFTVQVLFLIYYWNIFMTELLSLLSTSPPPPVSNTFDKEED